MPKLGLRFDYVESAAERVQLADFMRQHVGGYSAAAHVAWVDGVNMPAIARDDRRALAWWQDGQMVGNAVLKPLKPGAVELKNFRIRDGVMAHRGLGEFMLRQVRAEAPLLLTDKGYDATDGAGCLNVLLDTPSGSSAESFFAHSGFRLLEREPLYTPNTLDAVMKLTVAL